jgi:uncharacterized protein (TIGR03435 family)
MSQLMRICAALALLSGSMLLAQDLSGAWQGTLSLQGGRELRIVFKISKTEGALKSVMYSIDQPGPPIGVSATTVQGSNVKLTIPAIGGTYEGKLSPEANLITGTWSQGGGALPLTLKLATHGTAWPIPEPPAPPAPMKENADPSFEVATIKPSKPEAQGKGFQVRGRHLATFNTTLNDMITFAYDLHPKQIVGAPAWAESDRFDLDAQPDGQGQPSLKQWKFMMQKLLADRFKLRFHREKKELLVYAITVAKSGAKLTKSQGDPNGLPGLFFRGLGVLPASNASMTDLASVMQSTVLDRPVVDHSGIAGKFDFTLTWTPDEFQFRSLGVRVPAPADPATAPPDLFTAMQQQLGLKLESTRAPTDVIAIDRVQKPGGN